MNTLYLLTYLSMYLRIHTSMSLCLYLCIYHYHHLYVYVGEACDHAMQDAAIYKLQIMYVSSLSIYLIYLAAFSFLFLKRNELALAKR